MSSRTTCRVGLVGAVTLLAACGGLSAPRTSPDGPVDVSELWQQPGDLAARDLFHGPGGATAAPDPEAAYELVGIDETGYSRGYDVRDPSGTEWSVKLGLEAQPEVVVSRVVWAIGFHQPATYYLAGWRLTGKVSGVQPAGRFRPANGKQATSEWSWYENPFVSTQPFKGLIVANLILNNWDWKTSNNKLYEVADGSQVRRMYVVRDLGASLGKTSFPALLRWPPFTLMAQGSRNNVADFEEQRFIRSVDGDDVTFEYRGVHTGLVGMLTAADVAWTCRLMDRISDRQWRDAFRAAGYGDAEQERFIAKLKAKIREGLATVAG